METLGDFSIQQILTYVVIGAGVLIALFIVMKLFSGKKEEKHSQKTECDLCGWSGTVSRYAGRCPKCNAPLGDRRLDKQNL